MKKKIFGLILCVCMIFSGMFAFSGCSIMPADEDKVNAKVVMQIGNTKITKNDLISAFYTYYQNNSTYFAYYDEETIEESFYTWYMVKTMVSELSDKYLYNKETNPEGFIYYTKEDAETVWESVEDYFYSQISAYEEAIYVKNGVDEENYPSWLKDDDDEEETTKFEYYTSVAKDAKDAVKKDRKSTAVSKLSADDVYKKVASLKANLFRYEVESEDDENQKEAMLDEPLLIRNQAYANYIQALITSAKSEGTSTDADDVLNAEVLRIYEAYYESQISVIFQNYYLEDVLLNDQNALGDVAVVSAFLDQYYKDMQTNKIEEAYIETIEDSEGASLLMYHYNGEDYYFSVQHILVKFTDGVMNQIKKIPGYDAENPNHILSDDYIQLRNEFAEFSKEGILSTVNTDAMKDTLIAVGDYYYYDESKKTEWVTGAKPIYYGYVKLSNHTISATDEVTYTDIYSEENPYTAGDNSTITSYTSSKAVLMATYEDVLDAYETNYNIWLEKANQIFDGTKTVEEFFEVEGNDKFEDMRYVLEVAADLKANGATELEFKNKISSLLFIELEWLYSSDSLGNEVSNKIGYIVSSEDDEHMNWVVDFAVGARELLKEMQANDFTTTVPNEDDRVTYTKVVVTDYGYHIMKIENVYDEAHQSIINMDRIAEENIKIDLSSNNTAYVRRIASELKKTYICTSSNETLYDYFYDQLYTGYVGSSSSSGTYFLKLEYKWLSEYYDRDEIQILEKMGYDELIDTLS